MISPVKMAQDQPAAPGEAPFYIPATGAASRPRRTLKHNDTFAVFDSHGDIGATAGGPDGLFDHDTRYLSNLELLLNGAQPLLLGSAIRDDNLSYHIDLTNADVYENDRIVLLKDTVHITRTIYLSDGSLRERVALSNHGAQEVSLTLSLAFASDFADIFEVRGLRRQAAGAGLEPHAAARQNRPHLPRLDGRVARDGAELRAGTDGADGEHRHLFAEARARCQAHHLRHRFEPRPAAGIDAVVLQGPGCPASRTQICDADYGGGRDVKQRLERNTMPVDGRPLHADDGDAARPLPLRRHPLVFDELRPRRHHHRPADAVDGSQHCRRRAEAARALPGRGQGCAQRREPRQDPARDARRRDGGAGRDTLRPLLRQRRRYSAVRHARRTLRAAHRRLCVHPGPVAGDRAGAAMDRRGWGPRR